MLLPYIKLFSVFAFMLLGMRFRLGLGLSIFLGSFILALMFGIMPLQWGELALGIFFDRSILTVWAVVILVLSLSSLMESTGQAERFMRALAQKVTSPRVRMVFFPVLIGLLPMPGGAVFSAPMINAVAKELPIEGTDKSIINYWFRHTGEMSWPLYPAMILTASIGGITTPELILWTAPMSIVFFLVGWAFFVRPLKNMPHIPIENVAGEDLGWHAVLRHGAPLIMALAGALLFEILFALFLPQFPLDYGILVALFLAVVVCLVQNKKGALDFVKTLCKPSVSSMIFVVGALGVFKNILTGGGIVQSLMSKDADLVALWLCAIVLPYSIGALTGLMLATVGSIFPLLVALVELSNAGRVEPWLVLGLVSATAGFMSTPLHICFVLSCNYFKVNLARAVRRVIIPCLCFFAIGIAYFLFLQWLT